MSNERQSPSATNDEDKLVSALRSAAVAALAARNSELAGTLHAAADRISQLSPRSETSTTDPLSPAAIIAEEEKQEQKPDPIAELCKSIRNDIRLCDHGYIHITCGQCVATWLRG